MSHIVAHPGAPYTFTLAECVLFSPDGGKLFSGDEIGRINVGDPQTAKELASWQGHEGPVLTLATSLDGQLLASGGADRTIRIWDVASGRELAGWDAHDEDVTALAFSRDRQTLASGGADGVIKLWNLAAIREELTALGFAW